MLRPHPSRQRCPAEDLSSPNVSKCYNQRIRIGKNDATRYPRYAPGEYICVLPRVMRCDAALKIASRSSIRSSDADQRSWNIRLLWMPQSIALERRLRGLGGKFCIFSSHSVVVQDASSLGEPHGLALRLWLPFLCTFTVRTSLVISLQILKSTFPTLYKTVALTDLDQKKSTRMRRVSHAEFWKHTHWKRQENDP